MDRTEKATRAARLLDAVGGINEAFLDEYIRSENAGKRIYAPQISSVRRRPAWRVAIPVAAVFLVLSVVAFSALLPAMFRAGSAAPLAPAKNAEAEFPDEENRAPSVSEYGMAADSASPASSSPLVALRELTRNADPARTIPFSEGAPAGDGNTYVVWRGADGFCFSRALTADEIVSLNAEIGRLLFFPYDGFTFLWILGPDGTVTALLDPNAATKAGFQMYALDYPPTDRLVEIIRGIIG